MHFLGKHFFSSIGAMDVPSLGSIEICGTFHKIKSEFWYNCQIIGGFIKWVEAVIIDFHEF